MASEQVTVKEDNDHVNEEMRLLYQMSVYEIAFFKQQQWRVTNYGLLIYVVIITIPKILEFKLATYEYYGLFIMAFISLAVSWLLLGSLEESLSKGRTRLIEAKNTFSEKFKDVWRYGKSEDQTPKGAEDKPSLLWLFRSVMGLGFIIVSWLLYKMACAA